jgi:peptide/nickel transport system permease protein
VRFIFRRLGFYLLAAFLALTINFFLVRLMPGDPASIMLARFRGQLQPEAIAALRQTFGLTDAPLYQQFLTYLSHAMRGDFGISTSFFPSSVSVVILQAMGWTFLLAGIGLVVSFGVGSLLGIFAAWRRGGVVDSWVTPVLVFTGSFPYFWLAMLLVYILGFKLDILPTSHAYGDGHIPNWSPEFIFDVMEHLLLPCLAIVLANVGGWILNMRNAMIGTLSSEYLSLAQLKGLKNRTMMLRYAARNALLPNITGFGMAVGYVLAGSMLTEIVFSYPGQGYLLVQAVRNHDYPLMQGLFFYITVAVLSANWMVDIAYLWLDPRTRSESL